MCSFLFNQEDLSVPTAGCGFLRAAICGICRACARVRLWGSRIGRVLIISTRCDDPVHGNRPRHVLAHSCDTADEARDTLVLSVRFQRCVSGNTGYIELHPHEGQNLFKRKCKPSYLQKVHDASTSYKGDGRHLFPSFFRFVCLLVWRLSGLKLTVKLRMGFLVSGLLFLPAECWGCRQLHATLPGLCAAERQTQLFVLTRQKLYHLNCIPSPCLQL